VLQLPSIQAEDNFFDLGGDSSLAAQIFNEIAKECGRELPPVMIYQAPTIAALAGVLGLPVTPRLSALVLLRAGTKKPPVFMAHGLGGSAIDFFQPVRYTQSQNPIYGMQARGFDGVEKPFESIEDMAQFFLDAIRELQPRGPYFLIGYSLGGLVALEMAQQLFENGEKVALLALLETYPHPRYLSLGQRVRLSARITGRQLLTLLRKPTLEALSNIVHSPRRPWSISRNGFESSLTMQRVRESAYLALMRYRPRFYRGKIKFVRAEISSGYPDNAGAVWTGLADEFECATVPGDHLGIITTHYERLGAVLTRYLQEVSLEEKR
jgi:thioesterase domain-containing protein